MRIMLAFVAVLAAPVIAAAAEPSARAMQLAGELAAIRDAQAGRHMTEFAAPIAEEAAQGGRLTPEETAELKKDVVAAIEVAVKEDKPAVVRVLATQYTEEELAVLVAFEGSPVAASIKAKDQRVHEELKNIGRAMFDRVVQQSGATFCARRPTARFCVETKRPPGGGA